MTNLANESLEKVLDDLDNVLTGRLEYKSIPAAALEALSHVKLLQVSVLGVRHVQLDRTWLDENNRTREVVTQQMHEKNGAANLLFKVCYWLVKKHDIAEVERRLQRMWNKIFLLLRYCDTRETVLELTTLDLCGALAKRLAQEEAEKYPKIRVNQVFASHEMYGVGSILAYTAIYGSESEYKKYTKGGHERDELPLPDNTPSSRPIWQVLYAGGVVDSSVECTNNDDEPKWTVAKLVELIKAWQAGRTIESLCFANYAWDQDEALKEEPDRKGDQHLFEKVVEALRSEAAPGFKYAARIQANCRARELKGYLETDNVAARTRLKAVFLFKERVRYIMENGRKRRASSTYCTLEQVEFKTMEATNEEVDRINTRFL